MLVPCASPKYLSWTGLCFLVFSSGGCLSNPRTFDLFKEIGLEEKLIKYYLKDELKACPSYFNDHRLVGPPQGSDPYHLNANVPHRDKIPDE